MSAPSGQPGPRILVVGCGGIGGIVAAHLLEQGHDVTALTTNAQIADAINAHGFRVRGESSPGTVRGRAVRELAPGTRPFDYVLLATQPPQVEEAARGALPFLALGGAMVCFQNGLCEERIAAIAGPERTLGTIVVWGATMVEPGVYDRTSAGAMVVGRLDGRTDDGRLDELARIFEAIGPTTVTSNLAGARWSKLAINCAISSLGTVGGDRLGVLMRFRHVRRLALEIMTECVQIARALGVRLEKVSGTLDLDWIALTDAERHVAGSTGLFAKHALLLAVGARYRRLRSSMLAAIERGRPPAVDFLNGEIVSRGAVLGIATPINAAIRAEVLDIARGRGKPNHERIRHFYDRTRAIAGGALEITEPHQVAPAQAYGVPSAPADPYAAPLSAPSPVASAAPPASPASTEAWTPQPAPEAPFAPSAGPADPTAPNAFPPDPGAPHDR